MKKKVFSTKDPRRHFSKQDFDRIEKRIYEITGYEKKRGERALDYIRRVGNILVETMGIDPSDAIPTGKPNEYLVKDKDKILEVIDLAHKIEEISDLLKNI